jgi:type I restriction enzyme S subunit
MELNPEYKQAVHGVIPQDWEVRTVETIGTVIRGASPRPKSDKRYYGGNVPRLMVEDVTRDRMWVTPSIDFLTEEGAKRSRSCKRGTLTIVCSGTPTVVGLPSLLAVDACIHDGMLALVHVDQGVSTHFLFHQLRSVQNRLHAAATHGGTFVNLTTTGLRAFNVMLPPTKAEQEAIAEALSDVDALIGALDQLIVKKRELKQAAMQELLTGKQHLPGFHRKWEILNMSEKSSLKARIGWQGLTINEYLRNGDYYLVTGTDFANGRINWSSCCFVDAHRYVQDKNIQLKSNDILLTKDGTIGKVGFVDSLPSPATLNSGVFVIRPKGDAYCALFFYYVLTSRIFENFLLKLQAGSTISHLYQKDFINFSLLAPPVDEQHAIATILSDMDAELATLEQRRDKTRALKQGMMQELLTGRTRLI